MIICFPDRPAFFLLENAKVPEFEKRRKKERGNSFFFHHLFLHFSEQKEDNVRLCGVVFWSKRGTWLACLLDLKELNVEDEGGVGGDETRVASLSVAVVTADGEDGPLSKGHLGDTLVPTFDDLTNTDLGHEWLAAIPGGVELLVVVGSIELQKRSRKRKKKKKMKNKIVQSERTTAEAEKETYVASVFGKKGRHHNSKS